jgi:hypothetical protein
VTDLFGTIDIGRYEQLHAQGVSGTDIRRSINGITTFLHQQEIAAEAQGTHALQGYFSLGAMGVSLLSILVLAVVLLSCWCRARVIAARFDISIGQLYRHLLTAARDRLEEQFPNVARAVHRRQRRPPAAHYRAARDQPRRQSYRAPSPAESLEALQPILRAPNTPVPAHRPTPRDRRSWACPPEADFLRGNSLSLDRRSLRRNTPTAFSPRVEIIPDYTGGATADGGSSDDEAQVSFPRPSAPPERRVVTRSQVNLLRT